MGCGERGNDLSGQGSQETQTKAQCGGKSSNRRRLEKEVGSQEGGGRNCGGAINTDEIGQRGKTWAGKESDREDGSDRCLIRLRTAPQGNRHSAPMRTIWLLLGLSMAATGANWHVDCAGSDHNTGDKPGAAWKTLEKVNRGKFAPGDRILLKSGCVWDGQLAPPSSGVKDKPIIIDRYGRGARPRINGGGKVDDALRLYNVEFIEARNLELTNHGDHLAPRRGVHIFLDNFGTAHHIVVSDLYIHDVNGTNERKDNGGIIFRTVGDKKPSRFDGLTIARNIIWKVDRSAIAAQSYHAQRRRWFPSLNVVIRDNLAQDIGGDGIVPWATDGVVVEHNIARDCNRRAKSYNAGIWPWSADNSLFQLNEAMFTRTTLDGQGFDSDFNSRNTLLQYNYSHDNEGGFLLICSPVRRNLEDNVGNTGTVVQYNISRNDRARIFHLSGADQTTIHDNAVYVGEGLDVQLMLVTEWSGWSTGMLVRNNRFYVDGVARYGHGTRRLEDGTYTMEPGWGGAKDIVFEGNSYTGKHLNRPADDVGREGQFARPVIRWDAPEFDPAHPDGFDEFLKRHRKWMLRLFERQFGKPVQLGRDGESAHP